MRDLRVERGVQASAARVELSAIEPCEELSAGDRRTLGDEETLEASLGIFRCERHLRPLDPVARCHSLRWRRREESTPALNANIGSVNVWRVAAATYGAWVAVEWLHHGKIFEPGRAGDLLASRLHAVACAFQILGQLPVCRPVRGTDARSTISPQLLTVRHQQHEA